MNRVIEGKDIKGSQTLKTQVCIIGTGCGGATLGARLAKAGMQVTLLEQGGYEKSRTFDNFELNMAGRVSAERNMDSTSDAGINLVYGKNIGGTSVHYWADSYRTPTDRLQLWANKYGIEGHNEKDLNYIWPILDARLSVHQATDEYFNPMNQLVRKTASKLGWEGRRVPQARKNCQKSGHCMQGCIFDAKQSQLVTHIPDILEAGGQIFSDVKAEKLIFHNNKVIGLEARIVDRARNTSSNQTLKIQADMFVVAAGGLGSSTFLLRNNMAKKLPALGKYLSLNPTVFVHAIYEQKIEQWLNIPAAFGIEEFRLARYEKGNYKEGGYLLMPNQLQPGALAATIPGFGHTHRYWMEALPYLGGTIGWIDDLPGELGSIEVESSGRQRVHYKGGKLTSLVIKDLIKKQVILHLAAGAKAIKLCDIQGTQINSMDDLTKIDKLSLAPGSMITTAPHPAGGCRMGKDRRNSVVDMNHRVHGIENLYVADSSVFPGGVSVDPSYTIMAFSHRLAEIMLGD